MTTLCLCDVNEHDLRVFAEIAAAGRCVTSRPITSEACETCPDHVAPETVFASVAHTEAAA